MNIVQPPDHHLSQGVEAELAVEQDSITAGIENYRRQVVNLQQHGLESLSDYGQRLLARCVRPMAEAIEKFIEEASTKPGRKHLACHYLQMVDADVAALITCRTLLDNLTKESKFTHAAIEIGNRVEDEFRFGQFEQQNKPLFKAVQNNLDEHPKGYQRRVRRSMLAHTMKKFNISVTKWGKTDKLQLGMKLVDIAIESTGFFRLEYANAHKDTSITVLATEELQKWVSEFNGRSEVLYPKYMPMVCPPRPWSTPTNGGYLTPRMSCRLVKARVKGFSKELETHSMPHVYDAVNTLQSTAWRVNIPVLEAFKACWRSGMEFKGVPTMYAKPVPTMPHDMDTNAEARQQWKAMASDVYRNNEKADSKRMQIVQVLSIAERFAEYPAIWFPVNLDFRGRIYSVPQALNPQGSDLAKALLTFAEGKPLGNDGAWWLAVHCANTFGFDKTSMAERVEWCREHSDDIVRSAEDPQSNLFWTEADKPLQFLAACFEWAGFIKHGYDYVCSLPILVDGSCNGIQHFAAMLRDDVSGRHVNLVPQEKPSDIYAVVALAVEAALRTYTFQQESDDDAEKERRAWAAAWLDYGIDRSITKRPVMVLPYGGTMNAVREYLYDAIVEKMNDPVKPKYHPFGKRLGHAAAFLAKICWQVMGEVIVGPRQTMDWLREASKVVAEENLPITWTTPSGFLVQQSYLDMKSTRVATKVGDTRIRLTLTEPTTKLDRRKQAQAVAPNFVHSLDAAALVFTVNQAKLNDVNAFTAIHDSYGTLAADMQALQACLRQSFVSMYESNDVLVKFAEEVGAVLPEGKSLPPIPARGELDLRGVLNSEFFFA